MNKVLQKTVHGKCYKQQDMNKILQKIEYKENAVENKPVQKAIEKRTYIKCMSLPIIVI